MLEIIKSNINITLEEIYSFEKILKNKINNDVFLPQDYINFLYEYNGANFTNSCFEYKYFKEETGGIEIDSLCSINDLKLWVNSLNEIEFEGDYYDSLIRKKILTRIGIEKWGGEEISIGIGQRNNGYIYISKLYSANDFIKIAESFTEFLNNFDRLPDE